MKFLSGTPMIFEPFLTKASTRLTIFASIFLAALTFVMVTAPARAATIIRDPDIEYSLAQLAKPILAAAGLGSNVRVLVIDDNKLNAFVVDNRHIFLHSGLILKTDNAAMLQAVIAHEAAHIANGHITRRMQNFGSARTAASLGGVLAAIAGAAAGNPELGVGLALGVNSSAQRNFLAHTRAEEASADKSALRYMKTARVNTQGTIDVLELFEGQELLNTSRQDPYVRSHPLTRDRIRAAKAGAQALVHDGDEDATAQYWFGRAKGKLSAFERPPKWTKRTLKTSPSKDVRLMREAIMYHRQSQKSKAIAALDQAIAMRPRDPFLYELKGQILIESRDQQGALRAYKRAADLAPNNSLCLGGYGRALLSLKRYKEARAVLEKARSIDFRDSRVLRDLGAAYAALGNRGMAAVATAERYALQGRMKDAGIHAKRAVGLLPQGSAGWRRADDILLAAKRAARKK
ncbi:M48 family metalloprotease [Cognatishimia sp. D5M38]|uniref:M48 family metalloprotease n=1 Tax=Cognatishimia coralii TaxID=3083254 RepID=A0ABU8QCI1_9RHOB